ncbi:MAG TPA: aspartyl protease family protein [Phycisphaerae bacterium]|nr:aspartyl protease family protein [Phycisphaerae bacterium]
MRIDFRQFARQYVMGALAASAVFAFAGCDTVSPTLAGPNLFPRQINLPGGDVEVASQLIENFTVVSVFLNNTGPYNFILDTGAGSAVVSPRIAALFPQSVFGETLVNQSLTTQYFHVESLNMDTITFENFDAVVIDLDAFLQGTQLDGIVGLPLFSQLALTLDYPRSAVRVRTGVLPPPDNCETLSLSVREDGLLTVPVTVAGTTVQALVDSGNNGFMLLPDTFLNLSFIGPTTTATRLAVQGTYQVTQGCLADGSVSVGCVSYAGACVDVGDPEANLGAEGLRPFSVTIDQPSKLIHLGQ